MYGWYENCSRKEYIQMSELAQDQREFASLCEVHEGEVGQVDLVSELVGRGAQQRP